MLINTLEESISTLSNNFSYYLAVSSDSLYIIDPVTNKVIEIIVDGKDNSALLCCSDDVDHFLDCISIIKEDILNHRNPLIRIYQYNS